MIRHVVLCKIKENAPMGKIKEKIENLKNDIEFIKQISVGVDIKYENTASDFCIITDLVNKEDLDAYAKHPKHLEVIKFLKKYLTERRVADFYV